MPERILVAVDGSDESDVALRWAAALAGRCDTELLIVHALSQHSLTASEREFAQSEYAEEITRRLRADRIPGVDADVAAAVLRGAPSPDIGPILTVRTVLGEGLLASAEGVARNLGAQRVSTILTNGEPGHAILEIARDQKVDTIVVGTRGRSEAQALLLGSVSHRIVHTAPCTVVIAR